MNQTFNLQRFLPMLRLEIAEKGRTQLLMASVLFGVMFLMMLPIIFSDEFAQALVNLHLFALGMLVFFGGSLYTNQVFGQYDSTNSTVAAIMVPASRLEKFLSALLLNLLFIMPFVLLFLGLHIWTTDFANSNLLPDERKYEKFPETMQLFIILVALVIQGVAFLGAIFFTKAAYIKTAAAFFVAIIFGVTANQCIAKIMLPSAIDISATPFANWQVYLNGSRHNYSVSLPESVQYFIYILPVLILLSLWYIAYIRLVEKEV